MLESSTILGFARIVRDDFRVCSNRPRVGYGFSFDEAVEQQIWQIHQSEKSKLGKLMMDKNLFSF